MIRIFKYGRYWYKSRKEAEDDRKGIERIFYDTNLKLYYIKKIKKAFWE